MTASDDPRVGVRILLFAAHREAAGTGDLVLELPAGATAEDAYSELTARYPALADIRRYTSFAVNREVVSAGHVLLDGDELALLQPVSGGSHD